MNEEKLKGVKIGIVLTGSHCTMDAARQQMTKLKEAGAIIYPIISYSVTRATKERLIQNLALAIDQRRLTVLNSITLRDQLLNYRVEL
mgnify:CR=1 FL=1